MILVSAFSIGLLAVDKETQSIFPAARVFRFLLLLWFRFWFEVRERMFRKHIERREQILLVVNKTKKNHFVINLYTLMVTTRQLPKTTMDNFRTKIFRNSNY
jgi:hypothetical protein